MALTHHFLVKIAARRCKLYNFKSYALLGDDIVIANRAVAESYKRLLHDLDMPISMQKTHVSLDTYEFAKRWVHFGKEVTPFAINSILETWKSYPMFNNSIQTQLAHG